MTVTAESIPGDFPYPTVNNISELPTYLTLKDLVQQLKDNAASVSTELGGGVHGFLGILLPESQYQILTGEPWVLPDNLGLVAVMPNNESFAGIQQA